VRFGSDDRAHRFAVACGLADVDRDQIVAADTLHNLDVHAVVVAELDQCELYMFVAHIEREGQIGSLAPGTALGEIRPIQFLPRSMIPESNMVTITVGIPASSSGVVLV
jgi:hypothetical protein